jgi:hypothetical protein
MRLPSELGGTFALLVATSLRSTRMGTRLWAAAEPAAHSDRNESDLIYGTEHCFGDSCSSGFPAGNRPYTCVSGPGLSIGNG